MMKRILIAAILISFLCFIVYVFYSDYRATQNFLNEDFHGTINKVEFNEGRRGFPDIRVDSNWHFLGINEECIVHYIKEGDSIVKHKGFRDIIVYRKTNMNKWSKKVFKNVKY